MLTIEDVIKKVQSYNPQADPKVLLDAYEFAAIAHAGQKRLSGEDYIQHALATAWAFRLQKNGRWRVTGKDLDGDDLTVIVLIDAQGKVIAWTTF